MKNSSMRFFPILALAGLLAMASAATAAEVYTIDPSHSTVSFKVRHLMTQVGGTFNAFEGTVTMDRAKPEASAVQFSIDTASIDTNNENRDKHLRSEDFFHAEAHPKITFKSTKVEKESDELYLVTGDFTMRGVTKSMKIPVRSLGEVGMGGRKTAGFSVQTKLNRKDFNVNWNRALDQGGFVLSDDVEVDIQLQAKTPEPPKADAKPDANAKPDPKKKS